MFNDQSEIIHCSYIDDLSDKLHARVSESDEHNSANSFVERNNSYEDSDKFSSIFGNISINLFSFQEWNWNARWQKMQQNKEANYRG